MDPQPSQAISSAAASSGSGSPSASFKSLEQQRAGEADTTG